MLKNPVEPEEKSTQQHVYGKPNPDSLTSIPENYANTPVTARKNEIIGNRNPEVYGIYQRKHQEPERTLSSRSLTARSARGTIYTRESPPSATNRSTYGDEISYNDLQFEKELGRGAYGMMKIR